MLIIKQKFKWYRSISKKQTFSPALQCPSPSQLLNTCFVAAVEVWILFNFFFLSSDFPGTVWEILINY